MELNFERQAMKGDPIPKGLDIADSCLYIALKNLYAMYQNKLISRKDATEEKRRLIYNWETDKSKIESLNRDSDILRAKIGSASEDYKNNPCVETADKLYAALYNLPVDWRLKKRLKFWLFFLCFVFCLALYTMSEKLLFISFMLFLEERKNF